MHIPEYMLPKSNNGRYWYLSREDSENLDEAISKGDEKTAKLLVRVAQASRASHTSSNY